MRKRTTTILSLCFLAACLFSLVGCGGGSQTSGPAFTAPASVAEASLDRSSLEGSNSAGIDTSGLSQGYVGATAVNGSRLKFQVENNGVAQNYDLPSDGSPLICPLSAGSGSYTFRIMQNTSGNRYVELFSTSASVSLESEFAPFLRPNVFCDYTADSASVKKAAELVSGAQNQGDALKAIYEYITDNIRYDSGKAGTLSNQSGYVPNPDATLASGTGICFDYASLAAAMLRSQGIPCKIVTGYVSPNDVYHAWNMVYIDGSWKSVSISISGNSWQRIDTTFAANGASDTVGDGSSYTDRYTY